MSERPTDRHASRAPAAHGLGRGGRTHDVRAGDAAGAGGPSLAQRAASFRQGAPFLVERATLYDDAEPYEPRPAEASFTAARPPRRLLPAAMTLLGVLVVAALASGILFVRNADVARHEGDAPPVESASARPAVPETSEEPPGAQPNATTLAYDLTRRSDDVIVGAWRSTGDNGRGAQPQAPSAERKRRALPRRARAQSPELAPEAVTRPVAAVAPRYDAPEAKRHVGDSEPARAASEIAAETERTARADPGERPGTSVVARVGRASEPIEMSHEGPPASMRSDSPAAIPLETLALPLRRPDPAEIDTDKTRRTVARGGRQRFPHLQRQIRRKSWRARKSAPVAGNEGGRAHEVIFGDWFIGSQDHRP